MHYKRGQTLALIALFGAFSGGWQSEQPLRPGFGAVAGQVVDAHTGKPIAEAEVVAERDDAAGSGKIPHTVADQGGNFFLNDLSPGNYVIAASKEQDLYPNADNAAFASDLAALPKVSVEEGRVTRGIRVSLEKGGKLVGVVLDSQTKEPVVSSVIRLSRADNPAFWLRTGPDVHGHFEFIVPSRPFHMEVSATGYQQWAFAKSTLDHDEALLVKPESTKEIVVLLEKQQK